MHICTLVQLVLGSCRQVFPLHCNPYVVWEIFFNSCFTVKTMALGVEDDGGISPSLPFFAKSSNGLWFVAVAAINV